VVLTHARLVLIGHAHGDDDDDNDNKMCDDADDEEADDDEWAVMMALVRAGRSSRYSPRASDA
jgi:hypothetical protein